MRPPPVTRRPLAGALARVAALLLLLRILVPAGASAEDAAAPGSTASPGPAGRGGAVALPANAHVSERLFGLPGLSNVGRVAPGILRGAQPRPEGYETLRKMGIRTVVNLRRNHSDRAAVEAAGMRSIEVPISTMKKIDPAAVRKALAALCNPANQPVFIHCAQGKDRTGVVVAVYRMEVDGWREAEAEAEMEAFGFHEVWFQLKGFVRRYPEERKPGGAETAPRNP